MITACVLRPIRTVSSPNNTFARFYWASVFVLLATPLRCELAWKILWMCMCRLCQFQSLRVRKTGTVRAFNRGSGIDKEIVRGPSTHGVIRVSWEHMWSEQLDTQFEILSRGGSSMVRIRMWESCLSQWWGYGFPHIRRLRNPPDQICCQLLCVCHSDPHQTALLAWIDVQWTLSTTSEGLRRNAG